MSGALRQEDRGAMASIGVLTLELKIDHAHSLKDKRHVVKGLKEKLRNRFNVAVAEIDCQDLWQRSVVAVVTVAPDRPRAGQVLQAVEKEAALLLGPSLVGATVEWLD
jgi:uncharacterized protein YlxP (DUF503 family)